MDRNRFFAEVTRICTSQGITAGEINDSCLPLVFTSGSPICRISEHGEAWYGEKDMDTPEKVEARQYITSACYTLRVFVLVANIGDKQLKKIGKFYNFLLKQIS